MTSVLVWLPFLFRSQNWFGLTFDNPSFLDVYRHFDGPLYVVVAKTFYDPALIENLRLETILPPSYFAAHLPLYPFLISLGAVFFGYLKSMILVNIIATAILSGFFYYIVKHLKLSAAPLLLAVVFLFLPRFLIVRSVGAPESIFILFILASLFFFEKKSYLLAGLFGFLSVLTKTPGVLLAAAYGLVFVENYIKKRDSTGPLISACLTGLGLLAVFGLYALRNGDFFAYFHTGGVVPMPYPFAAFNSSARWIDTAWLEEIILYFFLYGLTVVTLWKNKYRSLFYFSLVFFSATLFIQHRDISRYSLPLWPMALIAFEHLFTSKKFLVVFAILLPGLYLYAWNFMGYNVMPIANWQPYLSP